MMQKYGYALPLYRQESEWKRIGLAFSRANLANWIIIASKEWLALAYGRMHEMLLEERCLHADETPIQVHNEKGRKNTSKSYMWVYASTALNPTRKSVCLNMRRRAVPIVQKLSWKVSLATC